MFIELWMVGVRKVPHYNQDTQVNIESYHGALKCWFALDTKALRGRRIAWLVWQLTTTIACHYVHTLEMEKKGFIKNKVMEAIITRSVEKTAFIPLTHVYRPTFESDGTWGVRRQCLPNVIYALKFPFIKIFCYTREWALRGNMCKHQIVVILTCTNIYPEDIIHCYGTWYGSHRGGLGHMFADPRHIPNDMESNDDDEDEDEHLEGDDGIMEFDGLMNMEQNDLPMGAIVRSNDRINSSTPMERVLAQLVITMQEITNECKEGNVTLCEYATSHIKILACNICNMHLRKANAVLHPRLVLHRLEDGLGNSVKRFKDWHETMFNHTNVCTKQCHE